MTKLATFQHYNFITTLFLLLRRNEHDHPLSFQYRKGFHLSVFLEVLCEAQKQDLPLFLVDDRTSLEEYEGFELGSLFQELLGVLLLEFVVMLIGLRPKADLLDGDLRRFCLQHFFTLLLLVHELFIVHYLAYRRIGIRGDFHKVEFLLVGHSHGVGGLVNARLNVLAHEADLRGVADVLVDPVCVLFFYPRLVTSVVSYCYD